MPKKPEKIVDPIDASFDEVAGSMLKSNTPKKLPRAKYPGQLPIGDVRLECAVLDDERRVLTAKAVFDAFGKKRRGNRERDPEIETENGRIQLPPFIASKNLIPHIDKDLTSRIQTIRYMDGGSEKEGYEASLLPEICNVYLKARRAGVNLTPDQMKVVDQAEILMSAFAKVGITALIDEATGYQHDRGHQALRLLLEKYIEEGLQEWVKTFPDTFFAEMDRVYGNEPTTSRKRPQYYGRFINKFVYDPIEHGYVKDRLNDLNIDDDGKRKERFHQWLTEQGRDVVKSQIYRVQGALEMCPDIDTFKKRMKKQKEVSIAPYLWDEMNKVDQG